MSEPFKNAKELHEAFGLTDRKEYEDFIPFKDGKPGFSIKRSYPTSIAYKPPVTKSGKPDTVAMIRVLYNPDDLPPDKLDLQKVPLWIDIGPHSKYHYAHFGYEFTHEDCPTADSLDKSKNSPKPVSLQFLNDFAFNHTDNRFTGLCGKNLAGADVLERVFSEHCDTLRETKRVRWRAIARVGLLAERCLGLLAVVLRILFRKKFDETRSPLRPYRSEDIVLLEADSLEIFGYKTTKNVILTYAVALLLAYTVAYVTGAVQWPFLRTLWKDSILVVCLNLLALLLLEHLGPHAIRLLANAFKRVRLWSIMRSPLYTEEKEKARKRRTTA